MANIIHRLFVWGVFERQSKNQTYHTYRQRFEESSAKIQNLIDNAQDTDKSRWELTHVIGMERWMQSRMKVALGEPFTLDEYDGYRPPLAAPWQDLKQAFVTTRQDSCDLSAEFADKNVDGSQKIMHNQFGDLSLKAWMEYALFHSKGHAGRMT